MKFFKNDNSDLTEEDIANIILKKEDRLITLHNIFNHLPDGLIMWFKSSFNSQRVSNNYVEIDIAKNIDLGANVLPGDIVIKKNRNPKINDVAEVFVRSEDSYVQHTVKIKKINFKEQTLSVENSLFPDNSGIVGIGSISSIIDKVIKVEEPEWKKIIEILDIEIDVSEIKESINSSIKYLKDNDFYDKKNTLKKLNERIAILNKEK